jgi:hypothetical protein
MPVASVLQAVTHLQAAEIIELITSFIPARGIDIMKKKGLLVWSVRDEANLVRTYVLKPGAPGEMPAG